ncbi:MAG: SPFH domain-containing protein [Oscillospiraceae bacterium]|nr:SPFH domain-containing protein [Oscillospiraceae bacterium]
MENKKMIYEEKEIHPANGWAMLFLTVLLYLAAFAVLIYGGFLLELSDGGNPLGGILLGVGIVWLILGWIPFMGLKVMRPNEALVLTLFGKYIGTLKKEGFFFVNPFSSAVAPRSGAVVNINPVAGTSATQMQMYPAKLSLKTMTHDNGHQKINDLSGNPIEVGIMVTWRVVNTAKAVFNVDNFRTFLSIQADSTLRDVARCYPYDSTDSDEKTLRGSSTEVSERLKQLLQERVEVAGLEIIEARITHLAYAQEIAAAMLQRQQATAIIEARQKIVDGAVGMVEMALEKLSESKVCELDEERKAQMVSNLLVVLCGNKDAQPIVNSGSIY